MGSQDELRPGLSTAFLLLQKLGESRVVSIPLVKWRGERSSRMTLSVHKPWAAFLALCRMLALALNALMVYP